MTDFYTNAALERGKLLLRGYNNGQRYQKQIDIEPSIWIPAKANNTDTPYKSIKNKSLVKKTFLSLYDCKEYVKKYNGVSGYNVYGSDRWLYNALYEQYPAKMDFDPSLIKIVGIDIECAANDETGFPDIFNPGQEVTAITLSHNNVYYVWGCGEYDYTLDTDNQDIEVIYKQCINENQLLHSFLQKWKEIDPDVLTGWNVSGFDVPYLYNRIKLILGKSIANSLSPFDIINTREYEKMGNTNLDVSIVGVEILDFMDLYKKHSYTPQESYKLDHVANYELGSRKLDYSEYDSLHGLYEQNHQKFISYNIIDTKLVDRMEAKLQLIQMVIALAYSAKINYSDTFSPTKLWDVKITNYLMDRNIIVNQQEYSQNRSIEGAYVKEPIVGLHKDVVSFDFARLYPSVIIAFNIGPETYVDKLEDINVSKILNGDIDTEYLKEKNVTLTATGCMFSKNTKSFLAAMCEESSLLRDQYKSKMKEAQKQLEKDLNNKTIQAEIAKYNNFQMAEKIGANSLYGSLLQQGFRWFAADMGESITLNGQVAVNIVEKFFNKYLNDLLKTNNIDYVIYGDTDSLFLKIDKLCEYAAPKNITKEEKVLWIYKMCNKILQPVINDAIDTICTLLNAHDTSALSMKLEKIADVMVMLAKKKYVVNVLSNEGVHYSEPKLAITGIEAVRSSTPGIVKQYIKDVLKLIMKNDQIGVQNYIAEAKADFISRPFGAISFPRGVSDLDLYQNKDSIYKKGCPIGPKAALIYNHIIKEKQLTTKHKLIYNDNKIKFTYLKLPNPWQATVIASPNDTLPECLDLNDYIDYEMQWYKSFIKPIETILNAIGWSVEEKSDLSEFFG